MNVRRFLRNHPAIASLLLAVAGALLMQLLEFHSAFASAEGRVANAYLRVGPQRTAHEILTIGIDDEDYREFFDARSPLNAAVILALVRALRESGAAVVGVDLLTDAADYQDHVIAVNGATSPVVWAAAASVTREPQGFVKWLRGAPDLGMATPLLPLAGRPLPGRDSWGLAIYPTDEDRAVRRLPRTWPSELPPPAANDAGTAPAFATSIAETYCREAPRRETTACARVANSARDAEILISFNPSSSSVQDTSVGTVFRCRTPDTSPCLDWRVRDTTSLRDKIVILGGTFKASRDFYDSPLGDNTSGLTINASAVAALLHGPRIVESQRLWGFGLDVVLGFCVGWFFKESTVRRKVLVNIALGVGAFVFGEVLFWALGVLWLSWVGALLTGVGLNVVLDILLEDDKDSHRGHPAVHAETTVRETLTTTTSRKVEIVNE